MLIDGKEIITVVSDFDGTVIKEGMTVPPDEFFQTVKKLRKRNIPFIAASGRQYANLKRILAPIADDINFICENGCLVVYNDEIVYKQAIERKLAMQLIRDLQKEENAELMISGEDTGYTIPNDMNFVYMLREKIKNNVTVIEDYEDIQEEMIKISIHWDTGIPEDIKKQYIEKYSAYLQVVDGGNGWLDFNALGAGKGTALKVLAKHMGIGTEQMIAFGDNENDITMLQEAGVSYAVNSAKDSVKAYADHTCEVVSDELKKLFHI